MNKYAIGGALAAIFIGIQLAFSNNESTAFVFPLTPWQRRDDAGGDGFFGAVRNGHTHAGTDYRCTPGQAIVAPMDGKVTRVALPYANDSRFSGCEFVTGNTAIKFFYMLPTMLGHNVSAGDVIGYAQDISIKYGAAVTPHIHIEVRKSGALINPETFFI